MAMQDNEFDKLFHSKLNDFEAEPSERVWDEVSDELTTGRRRKVLVSLLSVAASIIVLIAVGMLFFPQKGSVGDKPPVVKNIVVKTKSIPHTDSIAENNPDQQKQEDKNVLVHRRGEATVAVNKRKVLSQSPRLAMKADPSEPAHANKTEERDAVLITTPAKENVADLVIPAGGSMGINSQVEEKLPVISKVALPANQLLAVKKPDNSSLKPKKIRRLGDFINFVVAKVDKRPNKIIEFASADDGDDETRISGVNLGIVKIKNDK